MARNLFGTDVVGRSGSLNTSFGGMTYLKNGVMRRRVTPTNPQTSDQQDVRNAFLFYTTSFSGLTASQVAQWEAARTGNAYYLKQDPLTGVSRPYASAKDLFIAMNMNLQLANDGNYATPAVAISVPTAPSGTDTIAVSSVVADDSSNSLVVTYTGTFASEAGFLKATMPVSNGTQRATTVRSKIRNIALLSASPDTVAEYVAKYPLTGLTGQKIYYEIIGIDVQSGKARVISSGFTSIVA